MSRQELKEQLSSRLIKHAEGCSSIEQYDKDFRAELGQVGVAEWYNYFRTHATYLQSVA